jgi:hypothetical protein
MDKWKKFKRSGSYQRKVKKMFVEMNNDFTKPTTFTNVNNTSFVKGNTSKGAKGSVHNMNFDYQDCGIKRSEHASENSDHKSGTDNIDTK